MHISQVIFTHKNIAKTLWDNDFHPEKMGEKDSDDSSYLWSYSHISTIL